MHHRSLAALACCLVASACANTPGTVASKYDGVYAGTVTYLHAGANTCPTAGEQQGQLTVDKGSVVWKSPLSDTLYAPVQSNGAFQANENVVLLSGKITRDNMVARTSTGACHTVYDLKRTT